MNKTSKDYQFHITQCQNETRNKNEKDSKCGICSKKFNRIKYVQKHIRGGLISKAIFTLISFSKKWGEITTYPQFFNLNVENLGIVNYVSSVVEL